MTRTWASITDDEARQALAQAIAVYNLLAFMAGPAFTVTPPEEND